MAENKVYNTFNFVCKLLIPKETEKFKPYKKEKFDSSWTKESLMVTAKTNESSVLLTFEGGYFTDKPSVIKTFSKDEVKTDGSIIKGNKMDIAWSDRNKPSIINKVADFAKITFDLSSDGERSYLQRKIDKIKEGKIDDKELKELQTQYETTDINELTKKLDYFKTLKKEFISYVDMIAYLKQELPKHTDKLFRVKGNIEYSEYNGKVYRRFVPKHIEGTNETKEKLNGMIDIFYNANSLYTDIFEEKKKYILNGWVKTYDNQLKKDIYVPVPFIIDASRFNLDNPKHAAKLAFLTDELFINDDKIYELQYEVKFCSGAERKEITIDDLTEFQKKQIDAGTITFEELKKRMGGNKLGDNIDETRLFNINTVAYPSGKKDTALSIEDFIIVRTPKETNSDNVNNQTEEDDTEDLL